MTLTNRTMATALLGLGVAGVLVASGVAQATTGHEAAAAVPFGTSHLVQIDDLAKLGYDFRAAGFGTHGHQALSACSGETSMAKLTHHKAAHGRYANVVWEGSGRTVVTESIAQAPDAKHARIWTRRLQRAVAECQHEPKGHWRYSAAHKLSADGGRATWRVSRSGDGVADGGVAVLRDGRNVGIVELAGAPRGHMKSRVRALTRSSLDRLG